ncbi:MAG TPA: signal peptidase I [Melioribacteraceae bacterium]|nr:signal peptidase I [Melioribacteraceae bacterium]
MSFFSKNNTDKKVKDKPKTFRDKSFEFIKNLLFAAVAALLIKSFLIETSRVPTGSMEKTILVGDFLFVNKFIYGSSSPRNIPFTDITLPYFQLPALGEPDRFDIVVFEYPGDRDELKPTVINNYVKRLIGLPGDTVFIKDKIVLINGKEIKRPHFIQYSNQMPIPKGIPNPVIFPYGSEWNEDNYGPIVVPKKGDKIKLSRGNIEIYRNIIDREYGKRVVTVEGDEIKVNGKTVSEYTIKQNFYFMMGDNRDNSADSRFWGFVPREKILGQAWMIYWSWDPGIPFSNIFDLLSSVRLNRLAKIVH